MNKDELLDIINDGLAEMYDYIDENLTGLKPNRESLETIDRPALENFEKEIKSKLMEMLGE